LVDLDRCVGRLGTNVGHKHNQHEEEKRSSRASPQQQFKTQDFVVLRLDNTQ